MRRHRIFEASFPLCAPLCDHANQPVVIGVYGHTGDGASRNRARDQDRTNRLSDWEDAMQLFGLSADELAQAIPPAYTHLLGVQLAQHLTSLLPARA